MGVSEVSKFGYEIENRKGRTRATVFVKKLWYSKVVPKRDVIVSPALCNVV